jgi:single-strand DNA-binding protein
MYIGRLVSDVETKQLTNSVVAKFRLAVGRGKKNAQTGEWDNSDTMYIDCEAYTSPGQKRDLAGLLSAYVKKGDQIYVEGRLACDEWTDKTSGAKRSKHKVVVEGVELLSGKNGGGEEGGQRQPREGYRDPAEVDDAQADDVPF